MATHKERIGALSLLIDAGEAMMARMDEYRAEIRFASEGVLVLLEEDLGELEEVKNARVALAAAGKSFKEAAEHLAPSHAELKDLLDRLGALS